MSENLPRVSRMVNRWLLERDRFAVNREEWGIALEDVPLTGRPVLSISRQRGTRGFEIGRILATDMRYALIDAELMAFMTSYMGVRCDLLESLDDGNQARVKAWVDQQTTAGRLPGEGMVALGEVSRIVGMQGLAVMVDDGVSQLLDGLPALHVRMVAPEAFRVQSLYETEGMSEAEAVREIRACDERQAETVRERFGAKIDDPALYHLVLNRGMLDMDPSVQIIRQAMRLCFGKRLLAPGPAPVDDSG